MSTMWALIVVFAHDGYAAADTRATFATREQCASFVDAAKAFGAKNRREGEWVYVMCQPIPTTPTVPEFAK